MIKEYSIHSIVYGAISFTLAFLLNSYTPGIITKIFNGNIIAILIGLLAINIQVVAVISNRLNSLLHEKNADFNDTFLEIKKSIYEQCFLIALTFFCSFLASLDRMINLLVVETIFLFAIISSMKIFIDTTIAMLECMLKRID